MTLEGMIEALASGPGEFRLFHYDHHHARSHRWLCEVRRFSHDGETRLEINGAGDSPNEAVEAAYLKFENALKPDGMRRELMRAIEHRETEAPF